MKKKVFFGITVSLFAIATMFNISLSQQSNYRDMTLESIQVMTQAKASEEITPINYKAYYYPGTQSWCCFSGTTGCIPLNC